MQAAIVARQKRKPRPAPHVHPHWPYHVVRVCRAASLPEGWITSVVVRCSGARAAD